MATKPHWHGEEAREGRQQALANAQNLAGLLVHDLAHADLALAQCLWLRGLHAQAQRVARARGEGLDRLAVRHEVRHARALERLRNAAQVKAVGLGQVDNSRVGLHGLRDLLEHAREERCDVTRVKRVKDDAQRSCQALVCTAQVLEVPLALALLKALALGRKCDRHVRLACRLHLVAANPQTHGVAHTRGHGHERRRPVDGKGERVYREGRLGVKAARRREERAHVGADNALGLSVRQQGHCLVVSEKDPPRPVEGHHSLRGEL